VWEVARALDAAAAVNIQGDEPLVRPEMIGTLVEALFAAPETEVATIYTAAAAGEEQQPSVCKLVTDERGRALYFSRAAIPYPREGAPAYKKHRGFYAYWRQALEAFHGWPPSPLEEHERLEQLRFLHHGVEIACAETPFDTIGVDTAEDLAAVERRLAGS
jgi:3-deoxy-manno-octulosonate cytidylyltransferase (CMP-KDO synthetase)